MILYVVHSYSSSLVQVYYKVLFNRKQNPPDLLQAPSRFKHITRPRTNSAPAPYVPPGSPTPGSTSPTSSGNTSPTNSPSPPPSPISAPNSPINVPARQLIMKRRNSGSSNTSPISIIGASNKFQKMKIGTSTSMILYAHGPQRV